MRWPASWPFNGQPAMRASRSPKQAHQPANGADNTSQPHHHIMQPPPTHLHVVLKKAEEGLAELVGGVRHQAKVDLLDPVLHHVVHPQPDLPAMAKAPRLVSHRESVECVRGMFFCVCVRVGGGEMSGCG